MAADPAVVHARGGDGQTPLHFASTVEVAEFLLANGAEIDARDVDHESTPAQYMLRVEQKRHYPKDRQDVARYLVSRGCRTDHPDGGGAGRHGSGAAAPRCDPDCIRMNVSEEWFPKQDPRAGGTIYIWTLGAHRTAHTVARDFGHEDVFQLLMERTPEDLKLALACELGDEAVFHEFLSKHPDAAKTCCRRRSRRKLPNAAQSNNTEAVRLMLEAGWPVDTPGEMGATALHWAGFNGNAEMAREILRFHPALELKSREYAGTALAWAIFGSGNGWHRDTGDFVGTVRTLLDAGATIPPHAEDLEPSDAVLETAAMNKTVCSAQSVLAICLAFFTLSVSAQSGTYADSAEYQGMLEELHAPAPSPIFLATGVRPVAEQELKVKVRNTRNSMELKTRSMQISIDRPNATITMLNLETRASWVLSLANPTAATPTVPTAPTGPPCPRCPRRSRVSPGCKIRGRSLCMPQKATPPSPSNSCTRAWRAFP